MLYRIPIFVMHRKSSSKSSSQHPSSLDRTQNILHSSSMKCTYHLGDLSGGRWIDVVSIVVDDGF
jgi:hypothetical protein